MALHIRSADVDKLARKVAKKTGESLTEAIKNGLSERLARLETADRDAEETLVRDIREIASRATGLRKLKKTGRELIDELYDEDGLPR